MSLEVTIYNRQRMRPVSVLLLRKIAITLCGELLQLKDGELSVVLLPAREMTRLNERFLQHAGSTDVITFNYSEQTTHNQPQGSGLHGEIFICVDEALIQARRFHTTWQVESVRYLVHGALHLLDYDDQRIEERRQMKREENRLVRELVRRFPVRKLARDPTSR